MSFISKKNTSIDWLLLLLSSVIVCSSLVTLYNFTGVQNLFLKQVVFFGIALVFFFVGNLIDLSLFKNTHTALIGYVFLLGILTALFIFGHTSKGAQSWFTFGSFAFQPTDFMKLATILVCAKFFSRRHTEIKDMKHVFVSIMYMIIPFMLIFLQPDFGSAIILFFIWFGMILFSGLSKKHLLFFAVIGISLFVLLWGFVFKEYQKNRIRNFINPTLDIKGTGYNAKQSLIAVGSGQVFGKGIGYGTQSRLNFLPEHETDFIFAAFAEEWGFIGSILLILLYMFLLIRITTIALYAQNNFEMLILVGIVIYFTAHILINIGMNIGLMPITGITLPLMSYGGSHLVVEFFALGLVSSAFRHKRATHRDNLQYEFLGVEGL